ncbi:hypothetical protein [Flavobacterium sp.]|uniref:hypothetical protein n=1 Tax=Flavobacterium sp. TaxID=239 RepID=UPI00286E28BC|nr:hypothetical protein [Flavobacterium sp.]
MIKPLFVLLLFFCILQSHSQKLAYSSNGTILNSENQQISHDLVRELLKDNQKLLADYNAGRSKKTAGNVLLIGGSTLVLADLLSGVFSDGNTTVTGNSIQTERNYPSALTFVGLAAVVIAIPVKIGFSKKIRNVVTEYNNQIATGYIKPKLDLITNSNGIGLRFTLN